MYMHTELNLFVVKKTYQTGKNYQIDKPSKKCLFCKNTSLFNNFYTFPLGFFQYFRERENRQQKMSCHRFPPALSLSTSCTTHEIFKYKSGSALMDTQYLPMCSSCEYLTRAGHMRQLLRQSDIVLMITKGRLSPGLGIRSLVYSAKK